MATPKFVTAGATAYTEANMNRAIMSDGTKIQVKLYHAHILYNGSALVVDSAIDSAGIVTGDLAFDAGTTEVRITLSGFTNFAVGVPATHKVDTAYRVKAAPNSATRMDVGFYAIADGARIASGSLDTDMDFDIIIIGF